MTKKIKDQFTDLPVSRQRKYQLRHADSPTELARKERYLRKPETQAKRKAYGEAWRKQHPNYNKEYWQRKHG